MSKPVVRRCRDNVRTVRRSGRRQSDAGNRGAGRLGFRAVSRLTDLLGQLAESNPALADDLRRETSVLASRRPFGLNFERHVPETVEMYGRKIRRGDKVRLRPARGTLDQPDKRTWVVVGFEGAGAQRQASLVARDDADEPDTATLPVSDLVVVADFREPIYPGLRSTGKVERGGDQPYHLVINGENFHVLEALTFGHREAVDCIYIDPPYNTRDKDWKYNNDYVDSDDDYRHSKWLAMMERRLLLAKELLNPQESVLIVTIDEKEYLRLGLLLMQTFPDAAMQMISSVINPAGAGRVAEFSRTDEYIYCLRFGSARVLPEQRNEERRPVTWDTLRRSDLSSHRNTRPRQFYPIYVDPTTRRIVEIGDPLDHGQSRSDAPLLNGAVAVLPVRPDGTEMNWGITPEAARERAARGFLRVGKPSPDAPQPYVISYLTSGIIEDIQRGNVEVSGRAADGSVIAHYVTGRLVMPTTAWNRVSHDAQRYGTGVLKSLIPGRRFPFPKSLYAVEDVLRYFVRNKPDALILDFFAGSGTTAHAVMRLNRQDGGHRRCICVTNNEVSADEANALTNAGHRPGEPEWEALGIAEHITKPRITAAVTGHDLNDEPIAGNYAFSDELPMAEGFNENVEFFDLIYEGPDRVRHGLGFEAIAPLLWLRAGSRGARIESAADDFVVADAYAVLFNLDAAASFIEAVRAQPRLTTAYIVTDDEAQFQVVARQLPARLLSVRLYAAYLDNAKIVVRD
jgi:adenine-specific DNA-methyltransferase